MSETVPNNDYRKEYNRHHIEELHKKMRYNYTVGLVILVFIILILISTYMYGRGCTVSRNNNLLDMITVYRTDTSDVDIGRLSSELF